MPTKKLIEVALPLEKINAASAREKSIRHGHPSTLHMWWARRPLAAARAVIWASLVDDPSSHPELFPTEEEQNNERQRLFDILEDLVVWENSNNQEVLKRAKAEIMKYTNGNPPALLDPFAGGGAIPLEAQRLGLEAHAHDLNPVAVMINKAMIEIPPKFINLSAVNPNDRTDTMKATWSGTNGLAADIRYYGEWLKNRAYEQIGSLYPKAIDLEKDEEIPVIAWIWARYTTCPNPACGCEMPLVSSYILSKKGNMAWAEPIFDNKRLSFIVHQGKCPKDKETAKVGRAAVFKCPVCGTVTSDNYIKEQGLIHKIGTRLMAIVGKKKGVGRYYISPQIEHEMVANVSYPEEYPIGEIPHNPRWFSPPAFGYNEYYELFTPRQLTALTTFSELLSEAQKVIEKDALVAGMKDDHIPLSENGYGAKAYGEAVIVYLAFALDKAANLWSSLVGWMNDRGAFRETYSRQAMPMVWDFVEANPFSDAAGNYSMFVERCADSIRFLPKSEAKGEAIQYDAHNDCGKRNIMISTDPPYYDNIGYADLSDFFYIWMRKGLANIYPSLFKTMLVPKKEELISTPVRHCGKVSIAKKFFEEGMTEACNNINKYASNNIPVTIYYAYKQDSLGRKTQNAASSGWETMLSAIIQSNFAITGTWPIRTESPGRSVAQGTNALASSIVLVCRKREKDAPQTTRRNLISTMRRELRLALKKLQESNIAPVDLAQSAIGPGMGVFSRYQCVLEADGSPMTVQNALQIINEEIDLYFNEQVGELDAMSRFCVDLYTQNAFNDIKFGDADILARAKGTSVATMASHGIVYAKAGIVHLIEREELPENIDAQERCVWLLTQQLTQKMATGGVEACAKAIVMMFGSNAERAKDLAYRLFTIAEQKKWANEAFAYNAFVVAWPDIQSHAAALQREIPKQLDLFSMGLLES